MWYCKNKKCKGFGKGVKLNTISWPYMLRSQRKEKSKCLICGEYMSFISEKINDSAPSIMKFDSLSDEDKKICLKKRADQYFNKYEKEQVEYKKQSALSDMRKGLEIG